MRLLLALALVVPFAVRAEPPSPEDMAKIQYEQEKAAADVEKKYGDKKPSELSPEERRAMIKERAAAEREVLDKHGVDPKEYARAQAKQSVDDRVRQRSAAEKLKKDGDAKPEKKKDEVIIERGHTPDSDAEEAAAADRAAGFTKKKK